MVCALWSLPGGKLRKLLLDRFTDAVDTTLLGTLNQMLDLETMAWDQGWLERVE
jgi:hypothetical protein